MFILAWIRSTYKALSADASPTAVALGLAFGILLGCVPLLSGLGMLLLGCILIFRVQLASALFALLIVKALNLAGLPHLFVPVGEFLLETEGLQGFWTVALNLPVIAWLDLDRLAVTGGAACGLVIGGLFFWPARRLIIGYRASVHEKVSENKFFRWLTNFWLIKGLRFIFIGTRVA